MRILGNRCLGGTVTCFCGEMLVALQKEGGSIRLRYSRGQSKSTCREKKHSGDPNFDFSDTVFIDDALGRKSRISATKHRQTALAPVASQSSVAFLYDDDDAGLVEHGRAAQWSIGTEKAHVRQRRQRAAFLRREFLE